MLSDADADGEPDDLHGEFTEDGPKQEQPRLIIKLPAANMARSVTDGPQGPVRRSTRNSSRRPSDSFTLPSGSEYSGRDASSSSPITRSASRKKHVTYKDDEDAYELEKTEIELQEYTTSHGRRTTKKSYVESDDDALNLFNEDKEVDVVSHEEATTRQNNRSTRSSGHRTVNSDEEGDVTVSRYPTRSRSKKLSESPPVDPVIEDDAALDVDPSTLGGVRVTRSLARRITRKSAQQLVDENGYVDEQPSHDVPGSSEDEMMEDDVHTTPSPEPDGELDDGGEPKQYRLRTRKNINYAIPPPIEDMPPPQAKNKSRSSKGKGRVGPGWSANGTMLSKYMGMPVPGDDSDSDVPSRTPRKPMGAGAGGGLFAAGGAGLFPDSLAAGTPSNLGKVTDAGTLCSRSNT